MLVPLSLRTGLARSQAAQKERGFYAVLRLAERAFSPFSSQPRAVFDLRAKDVAFAREQRASSCGYRPGKPGGMPPLKALMSRCRRPPFMLFMTRCISRNCF